MWTIFKSLFSRRPPAEETPPGPKRYYDTPEDIEVSPGNCEPDYDNGRPTGYEGLHDGQDGLVACDYYPMSEALKKRFHLWSRAVLAESDDEFIVPPELEEEGMELARALKRELPQHKVFYVSSREEETLIE